MNLQQKTIEKIRQLINEETEYRSGPNLIAFFNALGFNDSYGRGFPSRSFFTEERLKLINGKKRMEDCIIALFSPVNFIGRFNELDKSIADLNQYLSFDGYKVIRNGKIISITTTDEDITISSSSDITEDEFLKKEFAEVSLKSLKLDGDITAILDQRLDEIKKCLNAKASLAVIFLSGSTLEGILLGVASNNPKTFNQSSVSPKDKDGKVRPFHEWTLNNFIDVACDVGFIGIDVKKFSHSLRDFRNYIHPFLQMASKFDPDEHTAKICWQVLKAAIAALIKKT